MNQRKRKRLERRLARMNDAIYWREPHTNSPRFVAKYVRLKERLDRAP